jgi:hypothetical protein
VVERTFGVLKRRWKILRTPPEFSLDIQADLVYATIALHNWICQYVEESERELGLDSAAELSNDEATPDEEEDEDEVSVSVPIARSNVTARADDRRDCIAEAMWRAYILYIK